MPGGARLRLRRQVADPPRPDRDRQPSLRTFRRGGGRRPAAGRGGDRRGGAVRRRDGRADACRAGAFRAGEGAGGPLSAAEKTGETCMDRRHFLATTAAAALGLALEPHRAAPPPAAPAAPGDAALDALFEEIFQRGIATSPEQATSLGLDKG